MAYGSNNSGNRSNYGSSNRSASQSKPAAAKREAIFRTGLFAPNKEGVKAIGTVQIKEDVTIPAGSYLNLYASDKKSDKSPAFSLTVTQGQMRQK